MLVLKNKREAMYIPSLTKYHENFLPTLEEMTRPEKLGSITYKIHKSKFHDNGAGIIGDHNHVDFANNVWHWDLFDCDIRRSATGGLQIELPRVNDIVEKLAHSVYVTDSYFESNPKFAFAVNGYYANVTVTSSSFRHNICPGSVIALGGMEKTLNVSRNSIRDNKAPFAFTMDTRSHSDTVNVDGIFQLNQIVNNDPGPNYGPYVNKNPVTYAIGLTGVQKITMRTNIIQNRNMQYELVAGITPLALDSVLDVRENWWGSQFQSEIQKRIFDFDDWNNYAFAEYFPQLTTDSTESAPATGTYFPPDTEQNLPELGGRVTKHLSLPYSDTPYRVVSDLTIMPGYSLIIEPGNTLEFYPNVGILALGKIVARGLPSARITMRPIEKSKISRMKRSINPEVTKTKRSITPPKDRDVRLLRDTKGLSVPENEGFLEMYNASSRSWTIMCDERFNEKTGEVVCRELGMETVNVDIRFTHLYDHVIYQTPQYFVKEFWAYQYYCKGGEDKLDNCVKRINYDIQTCIRNANYTYIRCGARTLEDKYEYWGNVRIGPRTYEQEIVPNVKLDDKSVLEYVDIIGAGMLHGEKTGAIQATFKTPVLTNINVTKCLLNGFDIVAPQHEVHLRNLNVGRNLGYGVNMLILNGESRNVDISSFTPLKLSPVPYFLHGLVDICKMEKEITINKRLIIFYKYSQTALDCVKVIRSSSNKQVAIRFLQFNLFHDYFYRNIVEVFDGADVSLDTRLAELTVSSSKEMVKKRYLSTGDSISLHVHASPSFGEYGFIAEAVSYPLSGLTYPGIV